MADKDASAPGDLKEIRSLHQSGRVEEAEPACRALLAEEEGGQPELLSLHGPVLMQTGQGEEGRRVVERAAEVVPETSAWASDLGLGLFLCGEVKRAREVLERAAALSGPDAAAFNRLAAVRLALGDMEGAESAFREALLRQPDRAALHSNLGGVLLRLEKAEAALAQYERALALEPKLPQAVQGRSVALIVLDRADEAITRLEAELEADPDSVDARRRLSRLLALEERFQEAEERLREAAEREPEDISILLELAALFGQQERYLPALKVLRQAAEREPDNVVVLNALARTYNELRQPKRAEETVEKALELQPEAPGCYITRALIRSEKGEYDAAEADLRRALELYPGSAEAWGALGHNLMWTGRIEEAVKCLERAAELNPGALAALVEVRAFPEDPAVVERMVRFANNPLLSSEVRASMCFGLIKAYENLGDYEAAFAYAERGNALQRKRINYKSARHSAFVDRIIETFSPEIFATHAAVGSRSERPVFVCGMPRSGTTLAEQVLASHPDVFGAGELGVVPAVVRLMPKVLKTRLLYPRCMELFTAKTAAHAAPYYLKAIARHDDQASRVVDKLPHNFLHVGLIALMFPNARIIDLVRDPRDVALSNYFTNFKHKRGGMAYAFDLAEIGHMINDCERIMGHWRRMLPIAVFDLNYEELVDDPEGQARALLDFVGLDWDDRVLAFHQTERPVRTASAWQVRQPMYTTSKDRWRHYERFLGPLEEVLAQGPARAAE